MNILKGMPKHTKRHNDGQHPYTPACALELCTPLLYFCSLPNNIS